MNTTKGFARGSNPGTRACVECKKVTWASRIVADTGLCECCYDAAGLENEHNDSGHDDGPVTGCPVCAGKR